MAQRHRRPLPPKVDERPSHDNRRTALTDEVNHLLDTLRDNLRRADAFISTAEHQIEENWHDHDDEEDVEEEFDTVLRHRMRVEYLVEAGKFAVRAALYTMKEIDAVMAAQRRRS